MNLWSRKFPFLIIILPFIAFCIALTFYTDRYTSFAQQQCSNDPNSLYDPCDDSVTQPAPSIEDGMMDPGIQSNEPTEETSQEIEEEEDEPIDGQDGIAQEGQVEKNNNEQQGQATQDEQLKTNNDVNTMNENRGSNQVINEKKPDNLNTLADSNIGQTGNLSELLSNTQVSISTCSNRSNQSNILGDSSNGSLELIFYGSTSVSTSPINIQITPNPYNLANTPLLIRDNQEGDCNRYVDVISLSNIQFSYYTIKQVDEHGNIVKSFQIPVNKNWPLILVNIQNKTFTKDAPVFETVPNQYIVAISDGINSSTEEAALSFASKTNAKVLKVFNNTRAFVFSIKDEDIDKMYEALSADSRLQLAEQNIIGKVTQLGGSQTIPTGVKRVISGAIQFGLYTNTSSNQQLDADIAIIDTGIDSDHPDLNVYKNISFVNGTVSGDDDNGHGSEVAGIAAAKNNMLGVVGMAPGAKLWSIKVCEASGKCPLSSQIEGIEYAIDHSDEIDVINISIENPFSSCT